MSVSVRRSVFAALTLLFAAAAPAQFPGTITVNPDIPQDNHDCTVTYSNPQKPNTTVTIEIDGPGGSPDKVEVTTDASGKGSTTWHIPAGWGAARNR